MKHKLKVLSHLTLVFICSTLACARGAAAEGTSAALMFEIPELKLENVSVQDAANTVLEKFRARYPDEQRIRGVVVSIPADGNSSVTMDTKNIPVGVALNFIARSAWGTMSVSNGVIHVTVPPPSKVSVTEIIEVSDRARRLLAIASTATEEELITLVGRLGVKKGFIRRIEYYSKNENDMLLVEGPVDEVNLLRAVFELIARGVDISPKKNTPE